MMFRTFFTLTVVGGLALWSQAGSEPLAGWIARGQALVSQARADAARHGGALVVGVLFLTSGRCYVRTGLGVNQETRRRCGPRAGPRGSGAQRGDALVALDLHLLLQPPALNQLG